MIIAITREVSPGIGNCELTHLDRQPIDIKRAYRQHKAYRDCLIDLGCKVNCLPADKDLPDSVFVEDTAIVLDELAIVTRPGAASRRPETMLVAEVLKDYRPLECITPPGTIDGGDVLTIGKNVYIGITNRTNKEGLNQVNDLLAPRGYKVVGIPISACLHLKSGVGRVSPDTLLINREWVPAHFFDDQRIIDVAPEEPRSAGALLIGDTVVYPAMYNQTLKKLAAEGIKTTTVDLSELAKAEAGVTCSSIVFKA